jgi:hypothetical protein
MTVVVMCVPIIRTNANSTSSGGDLLTLKARVEPIDEFGKKMLKPRLVYLLSRQTLPRLAATFIQSNYLDQWRMLYIEMSNRYDFSQHWPSDRLKAAT